MAERSVRHSVARFPNIESSEFRIYTTCGIVFNGSDANTYSETLFVLRMDECRF